MYALRSFYVSDSPRQVAHHFGIVNENAHSADADAVALWAIVKCLMCPTESSPSDAVVMQRLVLFAECTLSMNVIPAALGAFLVHDFFFNMLSKVSCSLLGVSDAVQRRKQPPPSYQSSQNRRRRQGQSPALLPTKCRRHMLPSSGLLLVLKC